jgi:hypothetical protein
MVREWKRLGGYFEAADVVGEGETDDASSKLLQLITKKCTTCGMRLTKNGGCIHFTCMESAGGCGHEFCWVCNESWPTQHGCTISSCKKPKARTAVERREEAFRDANEDCSFNAYAGRYAGDALHKYTALVDALRRDAFAASSASPSAASEVSAPRDVERYLELLRAVCATVRRSRMLLSWGRVVSYLGEEGAALRRFSFQRDSFEALVEETQRAIEEEWSEALGAQLRHAQFGGGEGGGGALRESSESAPYHAQQYPAANVRRALTTVRRQGILLKDAAFEVIVTTAAEEGGGATPVANGSRTTAPAPSSSAAKSAAAKRESVLLCGVPLLLQRPALVASFIGVGGARFSATVAACARRGSEAASAGGDDKTAPAAGAAAFCLDLATGALTTTHPECRAAFVAALRAAEATSHALVGDAEGDDVEAALKPFGSPHHASFVLTLRP